MGLYRSAARPLLFSFPPETAHQLAGAALRLPLPWGMLGGSASDPSLETDLAGIHLRNPVGLAAGFDKNCRELRGLDQLGFGYLVGGTVTSAPRAGNPKPRIVRLKGRESMVNSMGLPNDGVQAVLRRLHAVRREANSAAVLVSLADEDIADIAGNCELLAPYVDGFELNVSSPNSPFRHGRDDEQNLDHLRGALAAIADTRKRPVFVKLPPFRTASERDVAMARQISAAARAIRLATNRRSRRRSSVRRTGVRLSGILRRHREISPTSSYRPTPASRSVRGIRSRSDSDCARVSLVCASVSAA
jgi:hypothetical protein